MVDTPTPAPQDRGRAGFDPVDHFVPTPTEGLFIEPLLEMIEAQAAEADRTRRIDPALIAAVKATDVMRMTASPEIGGVGSSIHHVGRELGAVAARCPSLAWTLWNTATWFHKVHAKLGHRAATAPSSRPT